MAGSDGSNGTLPRVLLLDDEVRFLRACKRAFHGEDCTLIGVAKAGEALTILAGPQQLDCALIDITLPGLRDGFDVASEAKRLRPGLPIAILTGSTEAVDINRAADELYIYIAKGGTEALESVRRFIRRSSGRETLDDRRIRIVTAYCHEHHLTMRHRDVLTLRLQHKSTEAIAEELAISQSTVRSLELQIRERREVKDLGEILAILDQRIASE